MVCKVCGSNAAVWTCRCIYVAAEACLTAGELVATLLLYDSETSDAQECAYAIVKACVDAMSRRLFEYALRGRDAREWSHKTLGLPPSLKEAAVFKVQSQESDTLENALESLNVSRTFAGQIHKDCAVAYVHSQFLW